MLLNVYVHLTLTKIIDKSLVSLNKIIEEEKFLAHIIYQ